MSTARRVMSATPDADATTRDRPGDATDLLVVGDKDICAPPLVHAAIQSAFANAGWLSRTRIATAGVFADAGTKLCEMTFADFNNRGFARFAAAHRATQLTEEMVQTADLVLTAGRAERAAIARLAPRSQLKTFTWTEAAELAEVAATRVAAGAAHHPENLAELAALLHGTRGAIAINAAPPRSRLRVLPRQDTPADPLTTPDPHDWAGSAHAKGIEAVRSTAERLAARLAALA